MTFFRYFHAVAVLTATVGVWALLAGCASVKPPPPAETDAWRDTSSGPAPRFQLIYIVHGDANYTYHDTTGRKHAADSEAVAQARNVGANTPSSEVLVFYQTPRVGKLFGTNPDGTFYQYRRGRLLRQEVYSRANDSDFEAEARLFHKYALRSSFDSRFFTYFGHELPAHDGVTYFESYPDRDFSLAAFTRGVARFGEPAWISFGDSASSMNSNAKKPFGLIVLSMCYGGTPSILAALSPFTDYVLASPAYLHLSFLDTRAFKTLPETPFAPFDTAQIHALAAQIAFRSFERLRRNTQTEITVAVYDVRKLVFPNIFMGLRDWKTASREDHDCSEDPDFDPVVDEAGVEAHYQAPLFGPLKSKLSHSGWECPGKLP